MLIKKIISFQGYTLKILQMFLQTFMHPSTAQAEQHVKEGLANQDRRSEEDAQGARCQQER